MHKIDLSIVIPMYNSRETIIPCIESVLNQDYKEYEILIMDDGSDDDSYDIVNEYISRNNLNNIISLMKQKNSGPSVARNKLIDISKGKFIAFLDSDDRWSPDKLSKQMKILMADMSIKLLASNVNENNIEGLDYIQVIDFNKLLLKNYFTTSTVVVDKKTVQELGKFNENKRYSEDYELWLKIAKNNKCVLINESLGIYGLGKPGFGHSGLSSKLKEMEKGELNNYKCLYKEKDITTTKYIQVSCYSYLRYFRRVILTKIKK